MVSKPTILGLIGAAGSASCLSAGSHDESLPYCPAFYLEPPTNCRPLPETFLDFAAEEPHAEPADISILEDAFAAIVLLQEEYFDANYGTWPSAIDWTGAVTETVIAGMLTSMSKALVSVDMGSAENWKAKENLISSWYAQIVATFFGQDVLSIRGQAYDDMLWVVLGWIEAINFVTVHKSLHYPEQGQSNFTEPMASGIRYAMDTEPWHGQFWVPPYAHRSRIFWRLAAHGWDTKLCHGGMVWNPRLNPYKNAITNELWIAASMAMYQHFPGDNFTAPWVAASAAGFPARDPHHLVAAVEGYKWLKDVKMLNDRGLYVDGYHVDRSRPNNVECDLRDEMVYTYNQGVVLTGLRGLWAVTGAASYLEDGHRLIQSVIHATGWDLKHSTIQDKIESVPKGPLPRWHGIGRGGILEEQCDASGTCSQDGQSFKGIFFHHLTAFCAPLDLSQVEPESNIDMRGYRRVEAAHAAACKSYIGWVRHNALAALATRDLAGRFGMWWGASVFGNVMVSEKDDGIDHWAENTTDYRNEGTPADDTWGSRYKWLPGPRHWSVEEDELMASSLGAESKMQQILEEPQAAKNRRSSAATEERSRRRSSDEFRDDPNNRGRGRTVETQVGGLAMLRAYWEMSQHLKAA